MSGDKSYLDSAANLYGWTKQPIKQLLQARFSCPVFLENDAVAAALGEAYFGAGQGQDFVFVIWGTGIGGASVTHKGSVSTAEKLNWHQYFEDWERLCGGRKLNQRFGKEASDLDEPEWALVMRDFEAALRQFIDTVEARLIILSGGIANKQQARLLPLANRLSGVSMQISTLGEDAGLYGALALLGNRRA